MKATRYEHTPHRAKNILEKADRITHTYRIISQGPCLALIFSDQRKHFVAIFLI